MDIIPSWNIMVIPCHAPIPLPRKPFSPWYMGQTLCCPVEIDTPSWRHSQLNMYVNNPWLECATYLVDELRDFTHIREFSAKHKADRRYNSKVVPLEMWEGDLVLRQVVLPTQQGSYNPIRRDSTENSRSSCMEYTRCRTWMRASYLKHGTLFVWNIIIVRLFIIFEGVDRPPIYQLLNVYE